MTLRMPKQHTRLDSDSLHSYWSGLSERHLSDEDDGLGAICYAGMPLWFNRFLDVYQRKALARLLSGKDLTGARVLDIGTGVGRWARWYAQQGASEVVGIDLEPMRLQQAETYGGPVKYLEMPADSLDFPDASFDLVNSITVLQHVDHDVKRRAIKEISRVLKPGGSAVIFEISDTADDASHVYPWSRPTWIEEFSSAGLTVDRMVGDQYTPVLRMLKTAYGLVRKDAARNGIEVMKNGAYMRPSGLATRSRKLPDCCRRV